jgi:hypothetical protein
MSVTMDAAVSRHIDALAALEVVAKVDWLNKHARSVSKATHAFAKPIKVTLMAAVSDGVKACVLSRSSIANLQLEDNVARPSPLPFRQGRALT